MAGQELNGHDNNEGLPDYRILHCALLIDGAAGFRPFQGQASEVFGGIRVLRSIWSGRDAETAKVRRGAGRSGVPWVVIGRVAAASQQVWGRGSAARRVNAAARSRAQGQCSAIRSRVRRPLRVILAAVWSSR